MNPFALISFNEICMEKTREVLINPYQIASIEKYKDDKTLIYTSKETYLVDAMPEKVVEKIKNTVTAMEW